jgi:DNA primase
MEFGLDYPVILCEGFKAGMWIYQAGYNNVCCPLGTHMSKEQRLLIHRVCNEVVIFPDYDKPGVHASILNSILLEKAIQVRIARYPDNYFGKSPDDLTTDEIDYAIENAMSLEEWGNMHPEVTKQIKAKLDSWKSKRITNA